MSKSDECIEKILKLSKENNEMDDIIEQNEVLVNYTGKELDDLEDIPNWGYLMNAAEKLYDEYEEEIEKGTYDWMVFEYGPNRLMVWGELVDFIKERNTEEL